MPPIKALCLYCGSSTGLDPQYASTAASFGRLLAAQGITMIFGGGRIGLMGVAADAALAGGGKVVGVIPTMLRTVELAHQGCTELVAVETMHDRKLRMFEMADAFAILPGGLGTLDEAFEIITWRQLGLHDKPILLIDSNGYWGPFRELLHHVIAAGFAGPEAEGLVTVVEDINELPKILARLPGPAKPEHPERL